MDEADRQFLLVRDQVQKPEFVQCAHWYHRWVDLECDLLEGERYRHRVVDEPRYPAEVEFCDRLRVAAELRVHSWRRVALG
jgi:hypothetical protein